jgi:hypothetical protein
VVLLQFIRIAKVSIKSFKLEMGRNAIFLSSDLTNPHRIQDSDQVF